MHETVDHFNQRELSPFRNSFFLLLFMAMAACSSPAGEKTSESFLREHVEWLSSEERAGRLAGSVSEASSANYLENLFLQYGLEPAGDDDTFVQQFVLSGPMAEAMNADNFQSRNILGIVRGTEYPDQYIIVGAHFDGQGSGGIISMNHDAEESSIHYSADDNASGTAGLLWLAREFANEPPSRSILFAAFSGEELGLLGSRFMAENLAMPQDSLLAMINLDMIGRLDGSGVTIFGTGSSPVWNSVMQKAAVPDSLTIVTASTGTGASDHTSFYDIGVPVLHYFSGIHDQYHRESDTADLIDYPGMVMILEHVENAIRVLSDYSANEIAFTETEKESDQPAGMPSDSVTLGVFPDYTWSGNGFRIDDVISGGAAESGGLEPGDVIIQMNEREIADIYDYMEALAEFNRGETVNVRVDRDNEILTLQVIF